MNDTKRQQQRPKLLNHMDQGDKKKVAKYNEELSDYLRREAEETQKAAVNCGPWGDGE